MFSINRKLLFLTLYLILTIIINRVETQEILCNRCQSKISEGYNLIDVKSTVSLNSNYKKIFFNKKVLVHTFKNPHKILFEVVTVSDANLLCDSTFHQDNSFFPGYDWKICICPICGNHHGWHFTPDLKNCQPREIDLNTCRNKKSFYGLVTNDIISSHSEKIEL